MIFTASYTDDLGAEGEFRFHARDLFTVGDALVRSLTDLVEDESGETVLFRLDRLSLKGTDSLEFSVSSTEWTAKGTVRAA